MSYHIVAVMEDPETGHIDFQVMDSAETLEGAEMRQREIKRDPMMVTHGPIKIVMEVEE